MIKTVGRLKTQSMKGFTLVEIVLVLALLSIVLATAYNAFSFFYRGWERVEEESLAVQEARLALDLVGNDVRNALPAGNTIGVAINPEGTVLRLGPGGTGQIRYRLEGKELRREVYDAENGFFLDDPGVLCWLTNDEATPPFNLSGRVVEINWVVSNNPQSGGRDHLMTAKFTVRNGSVGEGS